jgi:2-keto-4-pentenoate hydratase/2-oxohepta-3-ene-1,7-dioic acid hydratase in catechol pathway
MRIANVSGRAHLVADGRLVDVERSSGGRLPADPMALIGALDSVGELAVPDDAPALDGARLDPPVPRPSKILAVGLNYRGHAEESGLDIPEQPVVFAKLPSALCGPTDDIAIPGGRSRVDWEAELVLVIGRRGRHVSAADAWSYVAGVTAGQDISDREEQFRALRQFTMAKSFDTYAPLGPVVTTTDELANPDDLAITCSVDGETVQSSRTADLIFPVRELIAWTSRICTLEAGDLIFTGTPSGVGDGRKPPRYLAPGMLVVTELEGVGTMRNACVAGPQYGA